MTRRPRAEPLPSLVDQAIDHFVRQVGGKEALLEFLAAANADENVSRVLSVLADPKQARRPIRVICQEAKVTPGELFDAFRRALVAQGQLLGLVEIVQKIQAITRGVAEQAVTHTESCVTCLGTGQITPEPSRKNRNPSPETCATCQGRGQVTVLASLDHQEMALKMIGLLKDAKGLQVTQQVQLAQAAPMLGGSLEELQQAIGRLAAGEVMDAEDVDAADPLRQPE